MEEIKNIAKGYLEYIEEDLGMYVEDSSIETTKAILKEMLKMVEESERSNS